MPKVLFVFVSLREREDTQEGVSDFTSEKNEKYTDTVKHYKGKQKPV